MDVVISMLKLRKIIHYNVLKFINIDKYFDETFKKKNMETFMN